MPARPRSTAVLCALLLTLAADPARAADGAMLATSGLQSIEGSAGGGLTTWALIAGHAERGEHAYGAGVSRAVTDGFALTSASAYLSWNNRLELSIGRQTLDLDALVESGAIDRTDVSMNLLGLKYRIGGDVIYGDYGQCDRSHRCVDESAGTEISHWRRRDLRRLRPMRSIAPMCR